MSCHLPYKDDGGHCLYHWALLLINWGIIIAVRVNVVVKDAWHGRLVIIVSGVMVAKL